MYLLQVVPSKSRWLKRRQWFSRIVVNGETVWTGETVYNRQDCIETITRLSKHMVPGSFKLEIL